MSRAPSLRRPWSDRWCVLTNVRLWHLASFRTHVSNSHYWMHRGHRSAPTLNGSVANDPKRTWLPKRGVMSERWDLVKLSQIDRQIRLLVYCREMAGQIGRRT